MNSNVIPGFESLTEQECFDMSARHILSTGVKSLAVCPTDSECSYKGTGCAARPFLTQKAANELMGSWVSLVKQGSLPRTNMYFILQLQLCHDQAPSGEQFMEDWEIRMREVAKDHNLSTAVLDEAKKG